MPAYAFVEGFTEEQRPTRRGQVGRCMVPGHNCVVYSVAGMGNSYMFWRHYAGVHPYRLGGEKGEWHELTQAFFANRGAEIERVFPTPAGDPDHRADVVLPDGRVIEIQSCYLPELKMLSREETYGDMAWIYDARDFAAWFRPLGNRADDPAFEWGKNDVRFTFHQNRPVYFDCGEQGIWVLESLGVHKVPGPNPKRKIKVYRGIRRKVAEDIRQFANDLVGGAAFAGPPLMLLHPKKDQTKEKRPPTLEEARRTTACNRNEAQSPPVAMWDPSLYVKAESLRVIPVAPRKKPSASPLRGNSDNIQDQRCQSCGIVLRFGVTRDLCTYCEMGL